MNKIGLLMEKINSVLLIEDDAITNFINSKIIQQLEITERIEVKNSGREALQFLGQCFVQAMPCPELILLDVQMPGMSGLEFLREFRKINFPNRKNVLVSILTTYNHLRDYENYLELDVHTFLLKPLTKEQLIPVLQKWLPCWQTDQR